ncbi:MAG: hypothetical protein Kow0092_40090 [Deferrisomatales bacterium]
MPGVWSRLEVAVAALLFSTGGAAVKLTSLSAWQVAGFRSAFALVGLWVCVPGARKGWTWRTAAVGTAYAGFLILFIAANKLTTAANSVFLHYTAPLYVLLLSPWLLGERITRRDVAFMAALAVGMALTLSDVPSASRVATDPALGNLLAALSGVLWALTLLGLRWLSHDPEEREHAGMAAVLCGCLICFLVCLPGAFPLGRAGTVDWLAVVYLGAVVVGVAYAFLLAGLRRVPAFEASLLLLLEPGLSPVWAWWLHGEQLGAGSLLGGGLILLATAAKTWLTAGGDAVAEGAGAGPP